MARREVRVNPLLVLALVLAAAVVLEALRRREEPAGPPPDVTLPANRNIRFGMPGPASTDPANREGFLVERPQYVLSYHEPRGVANWVSWQLLAADIAKAHRGRFMPDPLLPPG